jgi:hypothetical protein
MCSLQSINALQALTPADQIRKSTRRKAINLLWKIDAKRAGGIEAAG